MLLTEDGHLDINRIKKLTESEFRDEVKTWGPRQQIEWLNRGKRMYSDQEVWAELNNWIGEEKYEGQLYRTSKLRYKLQSK